MTKFSVPFRTHSDADSNLNMAIGDLEPMDEVEKLKILLSIVKALSEYVSKHYQYENPYEGIVRASAVEYAISSFALYQARDAVLVLDPKLKDEIDSDDPVYNGLANTINSLAVRLIDSAIAQMKGGYSQRENERVHVSINESYSVAARYANVMQIARYDAAVASKAEREDRRLREMIKEAFAEEAKEQENKPC